MVWMPQEGGWINAQLPGELTRARVVTVCSENIVICELMAAPISKLHAYRQEQPIPLRRVIDGFGEKWQAVNEAEAALTVQADEKAAAEKAAEEEQRRALEERQKTLGHHAFNVTRS